MNSFQDEIVKADIDKFILQMNQGKLIFIFPSKFVGGHEIMALGIIRKILSQGYRNANDIICVFPSDNKKLEKIIKTNHFEFKTYKSNDSKPEFLHAFFNPFYLYRCIKIIKTLSKEKNIILVQGDILQGVGFIVSGKLLRSKIISYIPYAHSFRKMGAKLATLKDFFAKIIYKTCEEYITISECFKHEIELKNKNARVSLIHNFVSEVGMPEKRKERDLDNDDEINIFIIGRVQFHQKGHDILIDALTGISDYKITLHVVGDGPDLHKLKAMQHKLPKNIVLAFHGWVDDSWRIATNHNIDFLVIPSLFEGVPLVMLEAQARDVPIIAAARDGMLDYLPKNSLYAVSGDEVAALRDKILYHIQNQLA